MSINWAKYCAHAQKPWDLRGHPAAAQGSWGDMWDVSPAVTTDWKSGGGEPQELDKKEVKWWANNSGREILSKEEDLGRWREMKRTEQTDWGRRRRAAASAWCHDFVTTHVHLWSLSLSVCAHDLSNSIRTPPLLKPPARTSPLKSETTCGVRAGPAGSLPLHTASILQPEIAPCSSGSCFSWRKTIYSCMCGVIFFLGGIAPGCWETLLEGRCSGCPEHAHMLPMKADSSLKGYCEEKPLAALRLPNVITVCLNHCKLAAMH